MAIIFGDNTDNSLYGGAEDDWLKGAGGSDTLKGGGGADRIDGGAGVDTAFYSDSQTGVVVNLRLGTGRFGLAEGDTLFNVENIFGSGSDDVLTGNSSANWLYGSSGGDLLFGEAGADLLEGAVGNDRILGGAGSDRIFGGDGIDLADYMGSPEGVFIALLNNIALFGDAHGDVFLGIENIAGSAYTDTLMGDFGANQLMGLGGDDELHGLIGDDRLVGGAGADRLIGGTGNDTYFADQGDQIVEFAGEGVDTVEVTSSYVLVPGVDAEYLTTYWGSYVALDLTGNASGNVITGNSGNNVINGHDGNDELWGYGGQDSFLFDTPLNAATNVDTISDFNPTDDTIRLDDAIFSSSLGLGNIADGEFVIGAAAQDANDRLIYNSQTGALLYDSDGNGATAAIQFARLSAGLALTYLDFYVV
jgi:serralysin